MTTKEIVLDLLSILKMICTEGTQYTKGLKESKTSYPQLKDSQPCYIEVIFT